MEPLIDNGNLHPKLTYERDTDEDTNSDEDDGDINVAGDDAVVDADFEVVDED